MLLALLRGEISQEDYLCCNNVTLLYRGLPRKIHGFIFKYKGRNVITINEYISKIRQKETILHELAHLELSHLENKKRLMEFKIENIEDEADRYIELIKEAL